MNVVASLFAMITSEAKKWRWLIFAMASMETVLFGGILFGWGSLVYVLKEDGVFAHLCGDHPMAENQTDVANDIDISGQITKPLASGVSKNLRKGDQAVFPGKSNDTIIYLDTDEAIMNMTSREMTGSVTCEAQDNMLSLCFTVCAACLYTTTSLAGALSYKFGTRTTRLVGWLSFTVGGLLTAFTSRENPWLLFGGLPPLGFGGIILLITNIQIGTLFDIGSSTVIATLCGLFDTSSVIMLFLKFAHETGIGRRECLLVLTGLHLLTLVTTIFFMPRTHFTWTTQVDSTEVDVVEQQHEQHAHQNNDHDLSSGPLAEKTVKTAIRNKPTLRESVFSVMFLMEVAWISLLQLRFSYFLAALNPWLHYRLGARQQDVSYFTNVSMYMMMGGLLVSLISGATFDFFKHVFARHPVLERRKLYPSVLMLAMTSCLGLVMSILVLIPDRRALYPTFLFTALLRSFLYSVDANVITLIFPPEYFAALCSVSDFVGGAVSMLQYALTVWQEHSGFNVVNYALTGVVALTFVHPVVQMTRGLHTRQTVITHHGPAETETIL